MSDNDLDELINSIGGGGDEAIADEWAAAFQEQQEATKKIQETPAKPAERASFDALSERGSAKEPEFRREDINLDVILDVPVMISMEIGRTRMNIRNLLQLTQGSVVELDRLAGEPMDVLVNGTLIAHGEVVVVNDKFGIRLTDVLSPAERVKKLR
jgi:flagellar motor switch protein FliN